MHAKGRAALLEKNYEEAIAALDLSRDAGTNTQSEESAVVTDLAIAYFERGCSLHRPIDFSMSMELLGQALQSDPSSLVALYNRAMVFQHAYFYPNALRDWKSYLARDSNSSWAAEARRQMALAESKMRAPDPSSGKLADLIEMQLSQVMASSLISPARDLAAELRGEHQDEWLADALAAGHEPVLRLLAGMVATRTGLQVGVFESELRELEPSSAVTRSPSLRVWRDFERLFRITHSSRIAACLPDVDDLIETCRRRHYTWFLAQSLLERSSCEAARGEFATAESTDREALEIARQHAYPIASLRAAGFLTGFLAASGQYRDAAELQYQSLELYWSRPLPYARSQEFFHDMVLANEGLGRWHAAKAAAESAATMAQLSGVPVNEAVNRSRWAGFAFRLGLKQEASAQYALAEKLFHQMANNAAVADYQAFAEAFAASAGDPSSFARLEPIVKTSTNPFVIVSYLHTAAAFAENGGPTADARRFLEDAIGWIEKGAASRHASPEVMEWRDQLQSCYRDLTRISILQNDTVGAYRTWQRFLRTDETLQGFRESPASGSAGDPATVLTYARLGSRYGVWVRSADDVRFAWVNRDSSTIDRLVRTYAALCSNPDASWTQVQAAGKPLRSELLGFALQSKPKNGLLLIQPDGELARIPWTTLVLGDEDPGKGILAAVMPTPVANSGPVRTREIQVRHALIVGATVLAPKLRNEYRNLTGIENEITAVRRAFPSADVLEGREATVAGISEHMENADALHFAGHAAMLGGRIHLLVAPGTSSEGLWRPAGERLSLAVLSACSTARYRDPEDPKPENLANALLLEGANQVIASLWDADSAATSFFMQSFYRNLRQSHNTALAMAEASAETRRQKDWSNPYFWASFSLFLRI